MLYEGKAPYHIPAFFAELSRGLSNVKMNSIQIKKIVDDFTILYNKKVQEEKKAQGGSKKPKEKKPQLAVTKGTEGRANTAAVMAEALVGGDDYDDEYGAEYGNEGTKRQPEADVDFM